jgi:hypothetical protein
MTIRLNDREQLSLRNDALLRIKPAAPGLLITCSPYWAKWANIFMSISFPIDTTMFVIVEYRNFLFENDIVPYFLCWLWPHISQAVLPWQYSPPSQPDVMLYFCLYLLHLCQLYAPIIFLHTFLDYILLPEIDEEKFN